MHLKLGSLVLVALFALGNLSCSGKTDEDDFNVDIVPESPFLSKGQRKLDTDNDGLIDETIEPLWYQMTLTFTNNTPDSVVIQGLNVTNRYTIQGAVREDEDSVDIGNAAYLAYLEKGDSTSISAIFGNINEEVDNFRVRVEAELVGWYGTPTEARDRFIKRVVFFTE